MYFQAETFEDAQAENDDIDNETVIQQPTTITTPTDEPQQQQQKVTKVKTVKKVKIKKQVVKPEDEQRAQVTVEEIDQLAQEVAEMQKKQEMMTPKTQEV